MANDCHVLMLILLFSQTFFLGKTCFRTQALIMCCNQLHSGANIWSSFGVVGGWEEQSRVFTRVSRAATQKLFLAAAAAAGGATQEPPTVQLVITVPLLQVRSCSSTLTHHHTNLDTWYRTVLHSSQTGSSVWFQGAC